MEENYSNKKQEERKEATHHFLIFQLDVFGENITEEKMMGQQSLKKRKWNAILKILLFLVDYGTL